MSHIAPGQHEGQDHSDVESDSLFINTNHASPLENDLPTLYLTSYGHRFGPLNPPPVLVFDLRTLPNPPKAIRTTQTGLSKPLREWLFSNEDVQERFADICRRLTAALGEAQGSGENEVSVGICCEMGKHRSVSFVEELARTKFPGWNVVASHRDVERKRSNKKSGHSRNAQEGDNSS